MAGKFNKKGSDPRIEPVTRVAAGLGAKAAVQKPEARLRRAVMACLLWEDMAFESGAAGAENIASLVPQVDPEAVAQIAIETRIRQKLRHVPLWLIVQMAKHKEHKKYVREVIKETITRPDQMTDLISLYQFRNNKKAQNAPAKIPNQIKKGLAEIFGRFTPYQLAKYDRDGQVKLRDVLRMVHAKPVDQEQAALFKQVLDRSLPAPDTWEVQLSAGADKRQTWERLITERKLGDLAFLRNLRNMQEVGVDRKIVTEGLKGLRAKWLLPLNFLAAIKATPAYVREVEEAMFRCYAQREKIPGHTALMVDVSGSMTATVSAKSQFARWEVAAAMMILATEVCERASIWATSTRHAWLQNYRGFGILQQVQQAQRTLGGGGIYTREAMQFLTQSTIGDRPDRVLVFTDEQDRTYFGNSIPEPPGKTNYLIDVSAHSRGINYDKVWTAEVSGWSENFLNFICELEGIGTEGEDDE